MTTHSLYRTSLAALLVCIALPSVASAQDEIEEEPSGIAHPDGDPFDDKLSADHPGFSDASATVGARAMQAELGLDISPADPVNVALSALLRYGIGGRAEARLELPALVFMPGDEATRVGIDTVEVGGKVRFPVTDRLQLALLPYAILPSGAETSPFSGPGFGTSLIADISLSSKLGITTSVTPKAFGLKVDEVSREYTWGVDGALGFGFQATRAVAIFAEGWATMSADIDITPAANGGVIWHLTPDIMLDFYGGAVFSDDVSPYGGLGFVYRYRASNDSMYE